MTETVISYRIRPPLYGINGGTFDVREISGVGPLRIHVTLVDAGTPLLVRPSVTGSGSVTLPGDDLGMLHNTRLEVTLPGSLDEWMPRLIEERATLAIVANRLIDWYRVGGNHPTVRRVPLNSVRGYKARDEHREGASFLGFDPGEPSATAGPGDGDLIAAMSDRLSTRGEIPLWVALCLDSQAELVAGEIRSAVILANASMETLVNRAYVWVAPQAEVAAAFSQDPPPKFWQLLKIVNRIVDTGLSNTRLLRLAARINRDRNNVSHGNNVAPPLTANVADAIAALLELGNAIDAAVIRHMAAP